jgi:hypothetical protein
VSKQRFPGAEWAPIPEHGDGPLFTKTQLIYHSTGTRASAAANRRWFSRGDVKVESTFIVDYDGGCLQLLEAGEEADANLTASRRAISVEVVGEAHEPYSREQVETCIALGRWAVEHHPIERRIAPAHNKSGIGWHVMFGAPGPWTTVRGKACPGGKRIAQVAHVIVPAVCEQPDPPTTPIVEETDVELYKDGNDLVAWNMLGRRRIENAAELNYWRASGRLGALKVTDLSADPVLADVVSRLPWTEAAR